MVMFTHIDREYGLPSGTMAALVHKESRGNPNAVSPAGARGLVQAMPRTRPEIMRESGYDPWSANPEEAVRAGAHYLKKQLDRFGNLPMALAAYNAGGGNVSQAVRNHGSRWLASLRAETRNYVPTILRGIGITDVDIANAEDFEERRYAPGTTDAERDAHDAQLREWARRAGIPEQLVEATAGNRLLQLLLVLVVGTAQKMAESHGLGGAARVALGEAPVHVPDGTNVTPTPVRVAQTPTPQPATARS